MVQLSKSWKVTLGVLIPALIAVISQIFGVTIPEGVTESLITIFGIVATVGTVNAVSKRKTKLPKDTGILTQINSWLKADLVDHGDLLVFKYEDPILTVQITDTGSYASVVLRNEHGTVLDIAQENEQGTARITMYQRKGDTYLPYPKGKYSLKSLGNREVHFSIG